MTATFTINKSILVLNRCTCQKAHLKSGDNFRQGTSLKNITINNQLDFI